MKKTLHLPIPENGPARSKIKGQCIAARPRGNKSISAPHTLQEVQPKHCTKTLTSPCSDNKHTTPDWYLCHLERSPVQHANMRTSRASCTTCHIATTPIFRHSELLTAHSPHRYTSPWHIHLSPQTIHCPRLRENRLENVAVMLGVCFEDLS